MGSAALIVLGYADAEAARIMSSVSQLDSARFDVQIGAAQCQNPREDIIREIPPQPLAAHDVRKRRSL
ncbi:MAG: hypothetical protein AAGK70_10835 [Pseudomonadota bacterium]